MAEAKGARAGAEAFQKSWTDCRQHEVTLCYQWDQDIGDFTPFSTLCQLWFSSHAIFFLSMQILFLTQGLLTPIYIHRVLWKTLLVTLPPFEHYHFLQTVAFKRLLNFILCELFKTFIIQ